MIVLITEVRAGLRLSAYVDIVTFKVVDGEPSSRDIQRLLGLELDSVFGFSYFDTQKQGMFFNYGSECVKGMHFNAQEHPEHFAA